MQVCQRCGSAKRLLALLATLVVTSLCAPAARAAGARDGAWWRAQAAHDRSVYLAGLVDGVELGENLAMLGALDELGDDAPGDATGKVLKYSLLYRERYLRDVTLGQMTDSLNLFFEDYRNRKIAIPDALWVVLNEIAGAPADDVERAVLWMRERAPTRHLYRVTRRPAAFLLPER